MTLVVDSSAVVAALINEREGEWVRALMGSDNLVAPHLMPVESVNLLRRGVILGFLSADAASLAHHDLLSLPVALFAYAPVADRIWELRSNLTAYDAWYVALAEGLSAPLLTLDRRLARASGPRCEFRVPPSPDTIQTGME